MLEIIAPPVPSLQFRTVKTLDLASYPPDRTIKVISTTDDPGRDKAIVLTAGLDTSRYVENSPVLWSHDHSIPAVGNSVWLRRELKAAPPRMVNLIRFAKTDDGERLRILYHEGALNSVSIGWMPDDFGPPTEAELKTNPRWAEAGVECIYRTGELWEVSLCNVPANPACTTILENAVRRGLVERAWTETFLGVKLPDSESRPEGGGWDETEDSFRYRIREPGEFSEFRTIVIKEDSPQVKAVYGKYSGKDEWAIQSLIFPKPKDEEAGWTKAGAIQWLADHKELIEKAAIPTETRAVTPQAEKQPVTETQNEITKPTVRPVQNKVITKSQVLSIIRATVKEEMALGLSRMTGRVVH